MFPGGTTGQDYDVLHLSEIAIDPNLAEASDQPKVSELSTSIRSALGNFNAWPDTKVPSTLTGPGDVVQPRQKAVDVKVLILQGKPPLDAQGRSLCDGAFSCNRNTTPGSADARQILVFSQWPDGTDVTFPDPTTWPDPNDPLAPPTVFLSFFEGIVAWNVIGHEHGHSYGLDDNSDPGCVGSLMGPSSGTIGGADTTLPFGAPTDEDCEIADQIYRVSRERLSAGLQPPPGPRHPGLNGDGSSFGCPFGELFLCELVSVSVGYGEQVGALDPAVFLPDGVPPRNGLTAILLGNTDPEVCSNSGGRPYNTEECLLPGLDRTGTDNVGPRASIDFVRHDLFVGSASDPDGLLFLEFYLDGQLFTPVEYLDGLTPQDCDDCVPGAYFEGLLPSDISPGQHNLTLLAADAAPFPLVTRHDLEFEFTDQYEPILGAPTADSPWIVDSNEVYDLTVTVTDHSALNRIRVRIDNNDRKGFFDWKPSSYGFSADQVACSGDGYSSKHPSETWGGDHVTLVACSSSRNGNTRTITFTLRPNATFGEHPAVPVSVRGWDIENISSTWRHFPNIFASQLSDSTPPSGYVDAPSPGSTHEGTTTFSGWAVDSSSVEQFRFFVDGGEVTLGSFTRPGRQDVCNNPTWAAVGDPDCPFVGWRGEFDTTSISNGSHTLEVRASDPAGNTSSWTRSFSVDNPVGDTTAPDVWVDGPGHAAVVSGSYRLHGWARDSSSVDQFRFYMDGVRIFPSSFRRTGRNDVCSTAQGIAVGDPDCPNVGWEGYYDTNSLSDGSHTFTVEAIDAVGNSKVFNRYFSVDNVPDDTTPPDVWVDGPAHAAVASGTYRLHGWARDSSSVDQFRFYMDGVRIFPSSFRRTGRNDVCSTAQGIAVGDPDCPNVGWEGYYDTNSLSEGSHTFTVEAIDALGNSKVFNRYFSVDNVP